MRWGQLWSGLARTGTRTIRIDAYIDAPELLDRVEGDDLLQKVIPVVALLLNQSVSELRLKRRGEGFDRPCQKGA